MCGTFITYHTNTLSDAIFDMPNTPATYPVSYTHLDHESFGSALAQGKGVSDAKVIRSLYQRAVGYEYEEEKKIIEYDKDGNVKPIKIEKTKKQVPPDVGAQCFWLKNRQRDKWQDRPEVIPDTGADDGDQVQFYLPDNRCV